MKKGNKLWYQNHKSRRWTKDFQSNVLALSDAQVKELVQTEPDLDSDELSDRSRLSMGAIRSYGYGASYTGHGPDYSKVEKWLNSRVGQDFDAISSEFVQFWKDARMADYYKGPITWLMDSCIDDREWTLEEMRKSYYRYWKRYYLDSQNRLQKYPKTYGPTYRLYKKVSDKVQASIDGNREIFDTFKYKISGDGPVPIGYYYLDPNNQWEQTQVFAVNLWVWNQDLPEEEQYWPQDTQRWWKPGDKRDADFLHFLHTNYKPVEIPGVGKHRATSVSDSDGYFYINYHIFVTKV